MIQLHNVMLPVAPSLEGETARQPLSLHLRAGQFFRVCGPTGSGKTALLDILSLRRSPPKGELSLLEYRITPALSQSVRMSLRRQMGVVGERLFLSEHLTAFENIALPLSIHRMPRRDIIHKTTNFITWLGLDECADKTPSLLSYTEKLRIVCARALITRPALIFLEGDLLSTDQELLTHILPVLHDLAKNGSIILFASRYTDILNGLLPSPSLTLPYQAPSPYHEPTVFSPPGEDTHTPIARESLIP